jgi:hypothetical protein
MLKGLCPSTIFYGVLSIIGIIINTVQLGFSVSYLAVGTLSAIGFLYALQCICVGGCWLYAWTYPLVMMLSIVFTVIVAAALFVSKAASTLEGAAAATAAPEAEVAPVVPPVVVEPVVADPVST